MSEPINDGGPAFPNLGFSTPDGNGMTLRDWFAGQALEGDMASQSTGIGEFTSLTSDKQLKERAAFFFRFADAMLAARKGGCDE